MFRGRIDFGVMLCPQYFYNKSYTKNCYWWIKKYISIESKLESITTYHFGFVVKLL